MWSYARSSQERFRSHRHVSGKQQTRVRWPCPLLGQPELGIHHWKFFWAALKAIWPPNDAVFLCVSACLPVPFSLLYSSFPIYFFFFGISEISHPDGLFHSCSCALQSAKATIGAREHTREVTWNFQDQRGAWTNCWRWNPYSHSSEMVCKCLLWSQLLSSYALVPKLYVRLSLYPDIFPLCVCVCVSVEAWCEACWLSDVCVCLWVSWCVLIGGSSRSMSLTGWITVISHYWLPHLFATHTSPLPLCSTTLLYLPLLVLLLFFF